MSSSITPGSVFQSTSLSRGKTMQSKWKPSIIVLSIHFPLTREDQNHQGEPDGRDPFNPLPSHEGRRGVKFLSNFSVSFNPLPSHEGRPIREALQETGIQLSIHFPLTREDLRIPFSFRYNRSFNPLPSHEGRLSPPRNAHLNNFFQSTSLSRGKT